VGREDVKYTDGSFFIKLYDGLIGDLNLNGLAFEISDLIYFNNHFIDPFTYPLEGERLLNSDINQDGRPGTLGDLVYFIRIITGDEEPPGKLNFEEQLTANIGLKESEGKLEVYSDWTDELGAAMFAFACEYDEPEIYLTERSAGLGISKSFEDGILKVLICDYEGRPIEAGEGPIIEVGVSGTNEVELQNAELADVKGVDIAARIGRLISLPEKFELGQNYPNPFNPTTTISFGLPAETAVDLNIYNIRGQIVKTLVSKVLPAGHHEVVWDGKNSAGEDVSSGVYFYRLSAGEFSESRKMIMLK